MLDRPEFDCWHPHLSPEQGTQSPAQQYVSGGKELDGTVAKHAHCHSIHMEGMTKAK